MANVDYLKIISEITKMARTDVHDDDDFDDRSKEEIKERDKEYSQLLQHFVNITKERNVSKERNKWKFFWIIMVLLIALGALAIATVVVILVKCTGSQIVESVPAIITAMVGFASAIVAVPLAIAKYLFSTKEDKYITEIISHTQEHDLAGRRIIKALREAEESEEQKKAQ
jgi:membrane protein implicated in regulation of membrane protease activity